MQRRNKPVIAHLESTIHEALLLLLTREGTSTSEYIRSLVLEDLKLRGLLTDRMLAEMVK